MSPLHWHFFYLHKQRLLCCCRPDTVRVGTESPNDASFCPILKQRRLRLVPSLQALLAEALSLSLSLSLSISLVLSLILSPIRLFEVGFSETFLSWSKLNTPTSYTECNFLCWVCTFSKQLNLDNSLFPESQHVLLLAPPAKSIPPWRYKYLLPWKIIFCHTFIKRGCKPCCFCISRRHRALNGKVFPPKAHDFRSLKRGIQVDLCL